MKWLALLLACLFSLLQYRLWVGEGSFAQIVDLEQHLQERQEENLRLKNRNEAMYAEIQDLKSGLDAIEERARHELGLIKQGETFYRLVAQPADKTTRAP